MYLIGKTLVSHPGTPCCNKLQMWNYSRGQTFCNLQTRLHLFYCIFHAIRITKCKKNLVYSVILGIFWVTLSCKHMWGSVRAIWMILACATYTHFFYHPMWASCSELQYSKTWWDKNLKSNIHEYLTISWP